MSSQHLLSSLPEMVIEELIATFKGAGELKPHTTGVAPHLRQGLEIDAVLFDIYGTLFISGSGEIGTVRPETRGKVFVDSFIKAGCEILSPDTGEEASRLFTELIKKSHEESSRLGVTHPEVDILEIWESLVRRLRDERYINFSEDPFFFHRLAVLYENKSNPVWPMPGSRNLLRFLADRRVPMGIVSNAQFYTPLLFNAYFDDGLQELGFSEELCFWSYVEGRAKPDLKLLEPALSVLEDQYSISRKNVLFVGNDMLNDISLASTAGCRTALFAGDRRSLRMRENYESIKSIIPDIIITELGQLISIMNKRKKTV